MRSDKDVIVALTSNATMRCNWVSFRFLFTMASYSELTDTEMSLASRWQNIANCNLIRRQQCHWSNARPKPTQLRPLHSGEWRCSTRKLKETRNVGQCPTWWPRAEHRWRPLFNVAKFGWRRLLGAVHETLPRHEPVEICRDALNYRIDLSR